MLTSLTVLIGLVLSTQVNKHSHVARLINTLQYSHSTHWDWDPDTRLRLNQYSQSPDQTHQYSAVLTGTHWGWDTETRLGFHLRLYIGGSRLIRTWIIRIPGYWKSYRNHTPISLVLICQLNIYIYIYWLIWKKITWYYFFGLTSVQPRECKCALFPLQLLTQELGFSACRLESTAFQ